MRFIFLIICILGFVKNEPLNDDPNPNEIYWDSNKPLKWSDFRGKPRPWSVFVAQTVSVIEQTYSCDGDIFTFDIKAKFNRSKSWTKTNEHPEVLLHEQKHFDLTEIYARKMRQAYSSLKKPCSYTMEELGKIYDEYFLELRHMQTLYDIETDHGLDKDRQKIWNKKIARQLHKLEAFAKPL